MDFNNIIIVCNCIIDMIEESKNNFSEILPDVTQELEKEGYTPQKVDLISQGFESGVEYASTAYQTAIKLLIETLKEQEKKKKR